MGTSEAGGYVDMKGNITGWLNELAFVPCDLAPGAMVDEWSGDIGCGVKYFLPGRRHQARARRGH